MKNRNRKTSTPSMSRVFWQGIFLVCLGALLAAGVNAVRPNGLPWAGNWSPVSLAASQRQGLGEIPLAEAWSLYQADKALFLDARDAVSFYQGHIKGAWNVPPGEGQVLLNEVMSRERSGRMIITYCDGVDCPLSAALARSLRQSGVDSVRVLVDGWGRWRKAGYPTAEGGR